MKIVGICESPAQVASSLEFVFSQRSAVTAESANNASECLIFCLGSFAHLKPKSEIAYLEAHTGVRVKLIEIRKNFWFAIRLLYVRWLIAYSAPDFLVIGNYRSLYQGIGTPRTSSTVVYVDDGVALLNCLEDLVNQRSSWVRRRLRERLFEASGLMFKSPMYEVFSMIPLEFLHNNCRGKIRRYSRNNFDLLKSSNVRISQKSSYDVVFVGAPYVEMGLLRSADYNSIVSEIMTAVTSRDLSFCYCAHPRESAARLRALGGEGVSIYNGQGSLERAIWTGRLSTNYVIGITSAALYAIAILLPEIQVAYVDSAEFDKTVLFSDDVLIKKLLSTECTTVDELLSQVVS